MRVWVELTTSGGDVSLPDGHRMWSYILVRNADAGPWRVVDEGMG